MQLGDLLMRIEQLPALEAVRQRIPCPASTEPNAASSLTMALLEAAKPVVIAALAGRVRRPTLVLVARPDQARAWADQIAAWLGSRLDVLLFPEPDALPYEPLPADPTTIQLRMRALAALADGQPVVVVACGQALMHRTFGGEQFRSALHRLRRGQRINLQQIIARWVDLGYRAVPLVDVPGTFSRRGGVLDIFPPTAEAPVRIDLFDDEIEDLRVFDPVTQRSIASVEMVVVGPAREGADDGTDAPPLQGCLLDHLPADGMLIVDEPVALEAMVRELEEQADEIRTGRVSRGELPLHAPEPHFRWPELVERLARSPRIDLRFAEPAGDPAGPPLDPAANRLPFRPAPLFGGRLRAFVEDLPGLLASAEAVVVVTQQSARLTELIGRHGERADDESIGETLPPRLTIVHGSLAEGWVLDQPTGSPLVLLTDAEIFGVSRPRRIIRRRPVNRDAFLTDLAPGDLVVHVEHGIGRFVGLVRRGVDGREREYLLIEYAAGDQLYVPVDQVDRVSRYIGSGDQEPALTRLGSQDWTRAKERVRRSVRNIAADLIRLYSARQVVQGHAFSPDTAWQHELEMAFPYVETPDQLAAIEAVKADMESPRPMDRLLCGDVGYGKTEVALRAAFKAVMDGKQVAVLVPTTVLAQQHYRTFTERLAAFPVTIEMLSRFRSEREQRLVIEKLATGAIDIVIGTHRLIQKDVRFKDLGLVIIDEEQRFGVADKERLKQLRHEVDVLTLTATPIPRTLHMALAGIRDLSVMETPPEERLPVKTFVSPSDDRLIREVILRELDRGGQVYFVHNRVFNIESVAHRLRELVPEATIAVAHGQMPEDQLERVMVDFANGQYDVLVCTTIIESGLDIPNVNTIIINHADTFGLAQLYQLRGRVGRGANRAYAYLLYDRHRTLTETAEKRLRAIFEAADLGAGFRIAMKDLEIRGAGNLLGAEQSGHISSVGFDLYMKLLAQAVEEMRASVERTGTRRPHAMAEGAVVDLPLPASLPASYVEDPTVRLGLYRRLAEARTVEAIAELERELVDRFGELPAPARALLFVATVRVLATQVGVQSVTAQDGVVTLKLDRDVRQFSWLAGAVPGVQIGHMQIHIDQQLAQRAAVGRGVRSQRVAVAAGRRGAGRAVADPTVAPAEVRMGSWCDALLAVLHALNDAFVARR